MKQRCGCQCFVLYRTQIATGLMSCLPTSALGSHEGGRGRGHRLCRIRAGTHRGSDAAPEDRPSCPGGVVHCGSFFPRKEPRKHPLTPHGSIEPDPSAFAVIIVREGAFRSTCTVCSFTLSRIIVLW